MFASQVSKTTSIRDARRRPACAGVTLVEVVIGLFLTVLASTALLILSASTGRSLAEMTNYVDLDHYNRVALDKLTRELRQVRYLVSVANNKKSATFSDKDGLDVTYLYSPGAKALLRTKNGQTTTLLQQCDKFDFEFFHRTPTSNDFALSSTSVTNCKVVSFGWQCSRSIFGRKVNTEQGQAARIVIRNKKQI